MPEDESTSYKQVLQELNLEENDSIVAEIISVKEKCGLVVLSCESDIDGTPFEMSLDRELFFRTIEDEKVYWQEEGKGFNIIGEDIEYYKDTEGKAHFHILID